MPLPRNIDNQKKQCTYCNTWVNRKSLAKHVKTKRCLAKRSAVPVVHEGAGNRDTVHRGRPVREQRGGADRPGDGDEQPVPAFRKEVEEDKLIFDMTYAILYDWQIEVLRLLDEQDDRKVLWIYDAVGGEGKTFLAKYIQLYRDCICLESGKKTDLAHCFTNERYVLFDYTRSMEETINYSIIENFKNGFLFSGKYDSQVKKFVPCKVCCFSNFCPDKTKLSEDRWMLYALDQSELTLM
ncbi:Hypothetical predicted protein [Mytilus galloprovincialis]|uniref:Helicase superfamily 3 single-stranded DNA/RNA virus domain-containing protein n=1 Tax=Mytilus galloprovincialis TaxID=29158 RepID=A0A8B6HSM7_MYTGA|nr:Hypothetical predicted protein [Mytilus galloprovincialis]